jgi:hypothetical protein
MGASRKYTFNTDIITVTDDTAIQNVFTGGGTLAAWTFLNGEPVNNRRIMAKNDGSNGFLYYYRSTSNGLSLFVYFSGNNLRQDTGVVSTDVWHHTAVTYNSDSDANRPVFYLDGQLLSSSTGTSPSGTVNSDVGQNLALGANNALNGSFRGDLCYLQMFDRILTLEEIQEVMVKSSALEGPKVGYWPMLGDSPERDLSGNGNDGAVTGTSISNEGAPIRSF